MKHIKCIILAVCILFAGIQTGFAAPADDNSLKQAAASVIFETISNGNADIKHITKDIDLPLTANGVQVLWISSDENTVEISGNKGMVKRPPFGEGYVSVFLTARFVSDKGYSEKVFLLRVVEEGIGYSYSDEILAAADKFDKDFLGGFNPLKTAENIKIPAVPSKMKLDVTTDSDAVEADGTIHRSFSRDIAATVYFRISYGYEILKLSYPVIIKAYKTEDAGRLIKSDFEWLDTYMGKYDLNKVTKNLSLPKQGPNGTVFEWQSDNGAINGDGTVNRTDESVAVKLTATGILEKVSDSKTFKLTVYKKAPESGNESGGMNNVSPGGSSGGGGGGGKTGGGSAIPVPDITPNSERYTDLPSSHWAYPAVINLSDKGIMSGYDKKFRPDDGLLREECVKIIVCAFGYGEDESGSLSFDDVERSHWAYKYILSAYQNKIIKGIGENLFGTGEKITREDFAVMIYNAVQRTERDFAGDNFADADEISDYAKDAVEYLKASGIVKGRGNNMFFPKDGITRAEAAQIIYNVLCR